MGALGTTTLSHEPLQRQLLLNRIEMVSNFLVHLEHVNLGLLKHSHHLLVASDLALVARVLQVVSLDMLPELLDNLRS